MQTCKGRYDPQLVKAILTLVFKEQRSYKDAADILDVSEKTIGRHCRHAKKIGFDVSDLDLSAHELAAKLQPRRFQMESGVLRRIESKHKFLTKKYIAESCRRYLSGQFTLAECYRHYLSSEANRKHFSASYFKARMKEQLRKEIIEYTKFFSIPWTAEDCLCMASFVGVNFRRYVERMLARFSSIQGGIHSCMKILNFMHGNKSLYVFVETSLASPSSVFSVPLGVLWKRLLSQSKSLSGSKWDKNFFDYVEAKKQKYQQQELKRFGLEPLK